MPQIIRSFIRSRLCSYALSQPVPEAVPLGDAAVLESATASNRAILSAGVVFFDFGQGTSD